MDEGVKKLVMTGVVIGCLIVAVLITYYTYGGGSGSGIGSIPKDRMTWVKCTDTKCNAEYEMNYREYAEEVQKKMNGPYIQPITCTKCGNDTILKAYKCEKCGTVFFYGRPGTEYPDLCPNPKCGYSLTKEKVEAKASENQETPAETPAPEEESK